MRVATVEAGVGAEVDDEAAARSGDTGGCAAGGGGTCSHAGGCVAGGGGACSHACTGGGRVGGGGSADSVAGAGQDAAGAVSAVGKRRTRSLGLQKGYPLRSSDEASVAESNGATGTPGGARVGIGGRPGGGGGGARRRGTSASALGGFGSMPL